MIRPIKPCDINRVAEIHTFGRRTALRGILPDDQLFNKINVTERTEYFQKDIQNTLHESYVYDDGVIRGFLTIRPNQCEDYGKHLEILRIYTDPAMKGEGIGSKLLDFAWQKAIQKGCDGICLWVVEENTAARNFYERRGYTFEGSKKERHGATQVRYCKSAAILGCLPRGAL
jgi:putative acetyltransferase